MVITELYLKNFGKFSERRFYLRDGVQVICGENEFGKSTIHAFIRAMLFGLERGRGKAAAKDDFTRYEPWDNPGQYAGVMRFVCGGRNFRLERSFDRYTKHVSLVCEDDGEELSVEQGDLEMLLGGITPSGFDSTVSVRQFMAMPGQGLADSLKNYAANYYETGSEEIDLSSALQMLRDRRKDAGRRLKEAQARREERRRGIAQECRYLEQDMAGLQTEFEEKAEELRAAREEAYGTEQAEARGTEQREARDAEQEETSVSPDSMVKGGIAGILIGIAGTAWGTLIGGQNLSGSSLPFLFIAGVIFLIGAGLLAAGIFGTIRRRRKMQNHAEEDDGKSAARQPDYEARKASENTDHTIQKLQWEMDRIQAEWKEKEIRLQNLREDYEEMPEDETEKECGKRVRALEMAEENLREAAASIGSRTSRLLDRRASAIFSELTGGKYISMNVGEKMEISVWDGVRRIPAGALSRGTIEQIYFAIRMAAASILQEEPMPVILDDTFAFYDDKRLKSALKWLSGQERQVIILSCQKREEEMLKKF